MLGRGQAHLPFHGSIIFQHGDGPHFVYPFIRGWTRGFLPLRAVVNKAAMNMVGQIPL